MPLYVIILKSSTDLNLMHIVQLPTQNDYPVLGGISRITCQDVIGQFNPKILPPRLELTILDSRCFGTRRLKKKGQDSDLLALLRKVCFQIASC